MVQLDLSEVSNALPSANKCIDHGHEDDDEHTSDDNVGSDAEERFLEEKFPTQATEMDKDVLREDIEQHLVSMQSRMPQGEGNQASFIPDDLNSPLSTTPREEITYERLENLFPKDIPVWVDSE